jgi:hypothetical protein
MGYSGFFAKYSIFLYQAFLGRGRLKKNLTFEDYLVNITEIIGTGICRNWIGGYNGELILNIEDLKFFDEPARGGESGK